MYLDVTCDGYLEHGMYVGLYLTTTILFNLSKIPDKANKNVPYFETRK